MVIQTGIAMVLNVCANLAMKKTTKVKYASSLVSPLLIVANILSVPQVYVIVILVTEGIVRALVLQYIVDKILTVGMVYMTIIAIVPHLTNVFAMTSII